MSARTVFTIGHSNHAFEDFVALLRRHGIEAILDVRSTPYSKRLAQYRRENLKQALDEAGIAYFWLGRSLGGRPQDRALWRDGRPDYALVSGSDAFREGIGKAMRAAGARRVALMCAERDPANCHRTRLVSPALVEQGVEVRHILASGELEPHADVEARLETAAADDHPDLFD